MKFLAVIGCLTLFSCFVITSAQHELNDTDKPPEDATDLETRWGFFDFFNQNARTGCVTGYSQSGFCVNLRRCPELLNQVRHINSGRIFQNLHEFTEPCPFRGQVCCPERRQAAWMAESIRTSTEPIWNWENGGSRTTRPQLQTSTPWTALVPKSTTRNPKTKAPSTKTKHKNRRLLPENECGMSLGNRIMGGKEANLEEHPWMALLRLRLPSGQTAFACGGSLISTRYVLTAAHCLKGAGIPRGAFPDIIRVGEHNTMTEDDCSGSGECGHQDIPVEQQIVHPEFTPYDPGTFNDIALIRLKYDASFNRQVIPVCLPFDGLANRQYDGNKLTTVGWGRTSNTNARNSPIKMKVDVPVVPYDICSPVYLAKSIRLRDTQMCAGGVAGQDSCQGDSGGPLLSHDNVGEERRWHIQGIVSTGPKQCGKADTPAIYTRVSRYINWILDNIRE